MQNAEIDPTSIAGKAQHRPGALLRMAWEQLQRELVDALRDAGYGELSQLQHPLMRYPPADGLRPSQLAERLQLSKQAVNDSLRDFESLGLIRLERDPADGRARIIRFTEVGWRFYQEAAEASGRVGERWAAQIGEERFHAVVAGLEAILALYPDADLPGAHGH